MKQEPPTETRKPRMSDAGEVVCKATFWVARTHLSHAFSQVPGSMNELVIGAVERPARVFSPE